MNPASHLGTCLAVGILASLCPAQATFTDLASTAGVAELAFGKSAGMADLDGDGLLDLVAINAGMENQIYRQVTPGTFTNASAAWGFVPDTKHHMVGLIADFDNDGDEDLYVANGGFVKTEKNQVLRNDLSSTGLFTDVSAQSLAGDIASQNFGATTQDFDNDGDLDIFLTTSSQASTCVVLSNKGNNAYNEVTLSVGVVQLGVFMHCDSGDFDDDGWPDVAVGNLVGNNLLYRNLGNGNFVDLAGSIGVSSPGDNFGMVLEDFDNDGNLDLFLPKFNNLVPATHPTEIYLNKVGSFLDVSAGLGLTAQTDMGHNTGDLDGDGYPDIFIGTGHPDFKSPDILYLVTPDGSGSIVLNDVSATSGIQAGGDTRCHGTAFGDYDGDGFLDVFVNNGGPSYDQATLEAHYLLHGTSYGLGWASFQLEGVRSNRSAIGAHLVATTNTGREVHLWRRAGHGFGNTNSPRLRVGLGSDTGIAKLAIRWPSGIEQTLLTPALAVLHRVVETGLVVAAPAVVGGPLVLDAVGPGGQVAELYFSPATFELALPGLGMLQLLPPLTPLGSVSLSGAGEGTLSFPIPANPSLAGQTMFVQGWFHDPVTFGQTALSDAVAVPIE